MISEPADANLLTSNLSRHVSIDGRAAELFIYRLDTDTHWQMEIVDCTGASFVWDGLFASAQAANDAFVRTAPERDLFLFHDCGNVVPFR